MAYRTPQFYLQLLTLLLFTNRILAFGRDVRFQYPEYYGLYNGAQESNPAEGVMRQQANGQTYFEGIQTIFSLTQQMLDQLNKTCWQLHMIKELLPQQGGDESISIMFQICWPLLSLTLNNWPEFPEEPDEPYIWPKQPLTDLPSTKKSPRHPFIDLQPITPLYKYQSPITRPHHRLPPAYWFTRPSTRSRQPPIHPEWIPAFWLSVRSAFPQSLNRGSKVWQLQIPSQEPPQPVRFSRKELHRYLSSHRDSKRQLDIDPKGPLPGDDYLRSFDALYQPQISHRPLEHPWIRRRKQFFKNDKDPPPNNPYMNQPPPKDILHTDLNVRRPKQPRNRFRGRPNADRISRAILGY